jgi:hypothetical protein
MLAVLALCAAAPVFAQSPYALRYVGTAAQHRRELSDHEVVLGRLFSSHRIAFVIVSRRSPQTSAYLAYPTGERSLQFNGSRANFRMLIRTGKGVVVRARRNGRPCFSQEIMVRQSGVWELQLPC